MSAPATSVGVGDGSGVSLPGARRPCCCPSSGWQPCLNAYRGPQGSRPVSLHKMHLSSSEPQGGSSDIHCHLTHRSVETSVSCLGTRCQRVGDCVGSPGFTRCMCLVQNKGTPSGHQGPGASSRPCLRHFCSCLSWTRFLFLCLEIKGEQMDSSDQVREWQQGQTAERTSRPWLPGDKTRVLFLGK